MTRLSLVTFFTLAISSVAFAAPRGIAARLVARDSWGYTDCGMGPSAPRYKRVELISVLI
jgi:hypothetical protein